MNQEQIEYYVEKYQMKMWGSTRRIAREWCEGIGSISYGEHERTDIENYIRETTMGDPTIIIDNMKLGRTEERPKQKLYDWEDLVP